MDSMTLRATRFTTSQTVGKMTRFGLTPEAAIAEVKQANARGGRKGAISRRRKPRVQPGAVFGERERAADQLREWSRDVMREIHDVFFDAVTSET